MKSFYIVGNFISYLPQSDSDDSVFKCIYDRYFFICLIESTWDPENRFSFATFKPSKSIKFHFLLGQKPHTVENSCVDGLRCQIKNVTFGFSLFSSVMSVFCVRKMVQRCVTFGCSNVKADEKEKQGKPKSSIRVLTSQPD